MTIKWSFVKMSQVTHFTYNTVNAYSIIKGLYYIPISDTSFELSVFWPPDTESPIK